MSPIHADICRYGIPFSVPVLVRGLRVERREGLLLRLRPADTPSAAIGEIAPLPGLHDETLDEAERSIATLIPSLPELLECPVERLRTRLDAERLPPSVSAGVEMAVLSCRAVRGATLPPFPGAGTPARLVPVNALLDGDPGTLLARASAASEAGFRTFKLKVRPGRTGEAVDAIRTLHRHYGDRIVLRLDANQSLGLDEAVEFGRAIPTGSVSYIEEPLADAAGIPAFHAMTGIRSALDESLWQRPELVETLPPPALGALVLKPNRIGSLLRSMELARLARLLGIEAVFSSAFESGVSLGIYALMAALASPDPAPCGLDTMSYLEHDLSIHPFARSIREGAIDPETAWHNGQRVREELLEPRGSWIL